VLLEAIYAQRQKHPHRPAPHAPTQGMGATITGASVREVDAWRGLDDDSTEGHARVETGARTALASTMSGVATGKPSLTRRSLSVTARRPAPSTNGSCANLSSTAVSAASTDSRSVVSGESDANADAAVTVKGTSAFDPAGFMPFIELKGNVKATEIVDEADLRKLVARIAADLGKKNDWEARTSGLQGLQKLAWGGVANCRGCVELIKSTNELVAIFLTLTAPMGCR
jgi:hypothetical protein